MDSYSTPGPTWQSSVGMERVAYDGHGYDYHQFIVTTRILSLIILGIAKPSVINLISNIISGHWQDMKMNCCYLLKNNCSFHFKMFNIEQLCYFCGKEVLLIFPSRACHVAIHIEELTNSILMYSL